jgi:hypothetical protein
MKTRLSRKGVDLGEARNGGIFGLFDSMIKETCRVSEDELDLFLFLTTLYVFPPFIKSKETWQVFSPHLIISSIMATLDLLNKHQSMDSKMALFPDPFDLV